MDLEHELRNALRAQRPRPGLAQRVLAADHHWQEKRGGYSTGRALAAAALLTIVLGSFTAREVVQRRQAQRAKNEVLLALRITGEKLRDAREHVQEIGERQ
jgi:hypothetical protein